MSQSAPVSFFSYPEGCGRTSSGAIYPLGTVTGIISKYPLGNGSKLFWKKLQRSRHSKSSNTTSGIGPTSPVKVKVTWVGGRGLALQTYSGYWLNQENSGAGGGGVTISALT